VTGDQRKVNLAIVIGLPNVCPSLAVTAVNL
jgi:hypothetical protein